jgi:hypothetical protein
MGIVYMLGPRLGKAWLIYRLRSSHRHVDVRPVSLSITTIERVLYPLALSSLAMSRGWRYAAASELPTKSTMSTTTPLS